MTTDREAFEAWHGGRYRGLQADIAWAAWQAALASERAKQAEPVAIPCGLVADLLVAADLLSSRWKAQNAAVGKRLAEYAAQLTVAPPAVQAKPVIYSGALTDEQLASLRPGQITFVPHPDDEAVRLLRAIAAARSEIAAAKAAKCTCSSFVLQYEGRCCCGRGSAIDDGEKNLESALDAIAAYLAKAKC